METVKTVERYGLVATIQEFQNGFAEVKVQHPKHPSIISYTAFVKLDGKTHDDLAGFAFDKVLASGSSVENCVNATLEETRREWDNARMAQDALKTAMRERREEIRAKRNAERKAMLEAMSPEEERAFLDAESQAFFKALDELSKLDD